MSDLYLPNYACEGVDCLICGTPAAHVRVTDRAEAPDDFASAFGAPMMRVEHEFRFSPCGCRFIAGDSVAVEMDVRTGDEHLPDHMQTMRAIRGHNLAPTNPMKAIES